MPYPPRKLRPDEEILLDVRPHWTGVAGWVSVGTLILAAMVYVETLVGPDWPTWTPWAIFGVAMLLLVLRPIPRFLRWWSTRFVVTTERVIHRAGLLARREMEVPLDGITNVKMRQSLFGRLFREGDVTLDSAGEGGRERFAHVARPERVQRLISAAMQARSGTGPASGPVWGPPPVEAG